MNRKEASFIRAHLNVSWLRPESALWNAIASSLISKYEIIPPSLDLGCGNGIFSFITAGGEFNLNYDWYVNVELKGFWNNKDIYDICKIDNLDKFISKKPRYRFDYGLDHKLSLIRQARALYFYRSLILADASMFLSFQDTSFKTVFSNILYWLPNLNKSLLQINRITEKNGTVILCMPNTKFFDYCDSYHWKQKKSTFLRLLNRGRYKNLLWTISYRDFSKITKQCGFKIMNHAYYLSPSTLKIWDIGLRPLSPLLIKMTSCLTPKNRQAIKSEWIETLLRFLFPLYQEEKQSKVEGGFHLFVLKK